MQNGQYQSGGTARFLRICDLLRKKRATQKKFEKGLDKRMLFCYNISIQNR